MDLVSVLPKAWPVARGEVGEHRLNSAHVPRDRVSEPGVLMVLGAGNEMANAAAAKAHRSVGGGARVARNVTAKAA